MTTIQSFITSNTRPQQESLVVVTVNGSIHGVNARSGELLWTQATPHDPLLHDKRNHQERIRSASVSHVLASPQSP